MIIRAQTKLARQARFWPTGIKISLLHHSSSMISLKRLFCKAEHDDETTDRPRSRFGYNEESYSQYLEEKEDIERQRSKYLLEIPHLSNIQLFKLVRRLAKYNMMDNQFFILLEKTMMNRLSDLEDAHMKNLLTELCLQAPSFKFKDFLFLEKRIEQCLENSNKFTIGEWIPVLHTIAVTNQNVSPNFSNMVWENMASHSKNLTEEEILMLLSTVVLTNQAKPDQIPKELLSKLTRITTTAEFVASISIVKHLIDQHNSHLIPEDYKKKVLQFIENSGHNTITLQASIVEICDLLKLGNLGQELKKLVIYCQENFANLSFSNLTRALEIVIKFSKQNPSALNQFLSNLMELQNDLANYILENGSSANLTELLQLGKAFCDVSALLKVENPEHRKSVLVLVKEGGDLLSEEKDPLKIVTFLHLIGALLESPYKNYLLKGNEILEVLIAVLEGGSTLKFTDKAYLSLLTTFYKPFTQLYKSRNLASSEISRLVNPIMNKATSVKLTSFERFVTCLTLLDQYSDMIGSPNNRSILLVKEQLLDRYRPPEK
jgi:hypothetical protein